MKMLISTSQLGQPRTRSTQSSGTKALIHRLSITGHQQVRRNFRCNRSSNETAKQKKRFLDRFEAWRWKVKKSAQIIAHDVVKIVSIHPPNNSRSSNNNQIVIIFCAASQFMATALRELIPSSFYRAAFVSRKLLARTRLKEWNNKIAQSENINFRLWNNFIGIDWKLYWVALSSNWGMIPSIWKNWSTFRALDLEAALPTEVALLWL